MKRFTDTEIWDKEWYMNLTLKEKLLVRYIFDKCDNCGVWSPNWILASTYIGEKVTAYDLVNFGSRLEFVGEKIFIVDFIQFQYGELTENCKPHRPIITKLKKYRLYDRVLKGYQTPIETPEEKEKDQEKEMEKDKEQEKDQDFGKSENLSSEYKHGSLVAEMKNVFKKSVTNYPEDISRDAKALFSIAKFFCATAKINAPPESEKDRILEAWEPVSIWISKDNFYGQKSLSTISNHIQEIVQKALHGDKAKNRQPAGASRDEIQAIVNERANSRR